MKGESSYRLAGNKERGSIPEACADRMVQVSRDASAEHITDKNAPTREQYFGHSINWVKDAGDIEYRDGPGVE